MAARDESHNTALTRRARSPAPARNGKPAGGVLESERELAARSFLGRRSAGSAESIRYSFSNFPSNCIIVIVRQNSDKRMEMDRFLSFIAHLLGAPALAGLCEKNFRSNHINLKKGRFIFLEATKGKIQRLPNPFQNALCGIDLYQEKVQPIGDIRFVNKSRPQ